MPGLSSEKFIYLNGKKYYQIGTTNEKPNLNCFPTPTPAPTPTPNNSCNILYSWGGNYDGELGTGQFNPVYSTTPIFVSGDWEFIFTYGSACFAIDKDEYLWAWGDNDNKQLGLGSSSSLKIFFPTKIGNNKWKFVYGGGGSTFAIKDDGTLWSWGSNNVGQLGNGTYGNTRVSIPTKISDESWASVSSSGFHSLGIKSDGTLWGWGSNYYGTLGNGESLVVRVTSPIQIGSDTWSKILASSGPDGSLFP